MNFPTFESKKQQLNLTVGPFFKRSVKYNQKVQTVQTYITCHVDVQKKHTANYTRRTY